MRYQPRPYQQLIIDKIIEYLQNAAGQEADIIWGNGYDDAIGENISVPILCTGFRNAPTVETHGERKTSKNVPLEIDAEPRQEDARPSHKESQPEEEGKRYTLDLNEEETPNEKELTIWPGERQREEKPQPKKTPLPPKKKEPREHKGSGVDLDNWFYRKFGGLFDDDDQAVN